MTTVKGLTDTLEFETLNKRGNIKSITRYLPGDFDFCEGGKNGTGKENPPLDSYVTEAELHEILDRNPDLRRHQMLPAFSSFVFTKS